MLHHNSKIETYIQYIKDLIHVACPLQNFFTNNGKGKGKGVLFIYRHLHEHEQQRFTMRSGVLTGNDTGGAAQVAAAHCPNERTLDPAVCS